MAAVFVVMLDPVLKFVPEFPRVVSVWTSLAPAKFAAELECDRVRALATGADGFEWVGDDADMWIDGAVWSASLCDPDGDPLVYACNVVVQRLELDAPGRS